VAFTCDITRAGDLARVLVSGEVDISVTERLREALAGVIAAPSPPARIEVNLAALDFIDSSGLGVLIGARKEARLAGITLVVTEPSPMVVRVLRVLGVFDALTDPPTARKI
jgi:anti-anti-sigma factor